MANSLELQASMKTILPKLLMSVGIVVELKEEFKNIRNDQLFHQVTEVIEATEQMDMLAQCNYALLFYSAIKVR